MQTISELLNVLSTITEIGQSEIVEKRANWKDSLLSGRNGNDLVDLYLCKSQNAGSLVASKSNFNREIIGETVGDMVSANLISLGYPMVYIKEALGLKNIPLNSSYALLYRSASVVLEAERLGLKTAALILDCSDLNNEENNFFINFSSLLLANNDKNCFHKCGLDSRVNLYFGLFDSNKNQIK